MALQLARSEAVCQEDILRSIDSIPGDLIDPISYELMRDPVVAADGITYDRESIEEWFRISDYPPNNVDIRSKALVPNVTVRRQLLEFLEKHPQYRR